MGLTYHSPVTTTSSRPDLMNTKKKINLIQTKKIFIVDSESTSTPRYGWYTPPPHPLTVIPSDDEIEHERFYCQRKGKVVMSWQLHHHRLSQHSVKLYLRDF